MARPACIQSSLHHLLTVTPASPSRHRAPTAVLVTHTACTPVLAARLQLLVPPWTSTTSLTICSQGDLDYSTRATRSSGPQEPGRRRLPVAVADGTPETIHRLRTGYRGVGWAVGRVRFVVGRGEARRSLRDEPGVSVFVVLPMLAQIQVSHVRASRPRPSSVFAVAIFNSLGAPSASCVGLSVPRPRLTPRGPVGTRVPASWQAAWIYFTSPLCSRAKMLAS